MMRMLGEVAVPRRCTVLQIMCPLLVLGQATSAPAQTAFDGASRYAVGWGTLMLINAGLAQRKNRSRPAWFFVSLFLGPIATLCIVGLDKVTPKAPSDLQ